MIDGKGFRSRMFLASLVTRILIFAVTVCLLSASLARANQQSSPVGLVTPSEAQIKVTNIATSPGLPGVMVVARETNGQPLPLLYTTDGGVTWKQLASTPWYHVDLLAIAPRSDPQLPVRIIVAANVYMPSVVGKLSDKAILFRSGDWGQTWATEVQTETSYVELAVSPLNANSLTRVNANFSIFCTDSCLAEAESWLSQSLDGGVNWTDLNIGNSGGSTSLSLSPVVPGEGYYLEFPFSYQWHRFSTGSLVSFPNVLQLALDAVDPNRYYGVDYDEASFLPPITGGQTSTNKGSTWTPWATLPANDCISLMAHPTKSNRIYLLCHSGLYSSANGGGQWEKLSEIGDGVLSPHYGAPGDLLWLRSDGLFVSHDDGKSWLRLLAGATQIFSPIVRRS